MSDDQTTVSYLFFWSKFFTVLIGVFVLWNDRRLSDIYFNRQSDNCTFFFRVILFSGGSKNIAGQMTVPFFLVVIFLGHNWCSYFDTSTNYGTYIQLIKLLPEKKHNWKKGSSSPREGSVFVSLSVCLSVCPSVRAKRGI